MWRCSIERVVENNDRIQNNQVILLHSRYSQHTQFHFTFSGLKIMSSDSRTWKYEFRFPNLKIWVQFSGLKIMSSDSRTWKYEFSFPDLKYEVETKKKFSKKSKKFQNSQNAQNPSQKCPNVFWTSFGATFSKIFFAQCSMEGRVFENFQKKIKNFSKFQNAQNRSQKCPNLFWTSFEAVFSKFFCPLFYRGSSLQFLLIRTPNNGNSICRKVGKKLKLRRPALHAIVLHCGPKSAVIAPPIALTDLYTRFLPKAQPYLDSMARTPKSKPYFTTLPKGNLS